MRLAERVVERERELRRLRDELAGERERGAEALRSLVQMAGELEATRRAARGQATRIRLAALREAADVHELAAEIAAGQGDRRLVEALAEAVERIGTVEELSEAEANGRPRRSDLFNGRVEVEIGPLADFSQLVGFEDAARSIAATSELSIERFSAGRATLSVRLSEPVELLRELEERCDLEFRVRDRRSDRLILDVGEDGEGDQG